MMNRIDRRRFAVAQRVIRAMSEHLRYSQDGLQKLMTSLINSQQNSRKKWKRTTHPRR